MPFPELPVRIDDALRAADLAPLSPYFRDKLKNFFNNQFHTIGDVTCKTPEKGLVVSNVAGTSCRVYLNETANGIFIENLQTGSKIEITAEGIGIEGPKGDKGDKGDTGLTGAPGPEGPEGPMGPDLPRGAIIIWSGALDDVPENWHICDGTEGTPDLRNMFIVGNA